VRIRHSLQLGPGIWGLTHGAGLGAAPALWRPGSGEGAAGPRCDCEDSEARAGRDWAFIRFTISQRICTAAARARLGDELACAAGMSECSMDSGSSRATRAGRGQMRGARGRRQGMDRGRRGRTSRGDAEGEGSGSGRRATRDEGEASAPQGGGRRGRGGQRRRSGGAGDPGSYVRICAAALRVGRPGTCF
jgi:hypothetical protein